MNVIEAAKELKCGKKIRRKVWEYMSHPFKDKYLMEAMKQLDEGVGITKKASDRYCENDLIICRITSLKSRLSGKNIIETLSFKLSLDDLLSNDWEVVEWT